VPVSSIVIKYRVIANRKCCYNQARKWKYQDIQCLIMEFLKIKQTNVLYDFAWEGEHRQHLHTKFGVFSVFHSENTYGLNENCVL
jgi:hypothetical protein